MVHPAGGQQMLLHLENYKPRRGRLFRIKKTEGMLWMHGNVVSLFLFHHSVQSLHWPP